jgi:tetratricopeptide (TPR) repeat protein
MSAYDPKRKLGYIYRDTGRYQQAEEFFLEAMKIDEAAIQPNATNLANRLTGLASVYRRQARYTEAEKALSRALTMTIPDVDRATALNSLGLIHSTIGQYEQAEKNLNEALAIEKIVLPKSATLTLDTLTNLAELDLSNGTFGDAEAKRRDILKQIEAREPPQSTAIALHSTLLAATLIPQGKLDEAGALRCLSEANQLRSEICTAPQTDDPAGEVRERTKSGLLCPHP